MTAEEYLEIERKNEYKSEYYEGRMIPMPPASLRHNRLSVRLSGVFDAHLTGTKCEAYATDVRVLVNPGGLYTYPDVFVVCGEPKVSDAFNDMVENPALIVEILSPRSEAYDRGKKARLYRGMESLREYLLVAQDSYDVELHRKQADGTWITIDATGLDASIELRSIAYTLHLRDLYERIIGA